MISFTVGQKRVDVFPSACAGRPAVYLNTYVDEGGRIVELLRETGCPDFSLVAISGLAWNHDMTPWDIPPVSENGAPCTGGADDYIKVLAEDIVPRSEQAMAGTPAWRGMAGYSLAGLFAIYSMYKTDMFSRFASISGSLWFPGIMEFIHSSEPARWPDCVYFSLGNRESRTRNKYMRCVQENTGEIAAFYRGRGVDTEFSLNPGGHFRDGAQRTAAGLQWLLSR